MKHLHTFKLFENVRNYQYFHGTTLKNFNKVKDLSNLNFTPVYDDAVMYALIGNEANFENKIKNANSNIIKLLYENPKQALIKLFDSSDKPIILVYNTNQDFTDEYEISFDNIKKEDLVIKHIDFDEYDKVSPVWVDLNNYL
jgi:hypothetical protein